MGDFILTAQNLSKQYKSQRNKYAINDLNLSICEGSLYGLIGPDGAGKSTTLRILSTVIKPTSGDVHINGFNTLKDPESIRPFIGYMPQLFSLYQDLTVKENLDFFASINKVPKAEKETRIHEMMTFIHLEAYHDRRARNLSGGMKKKLALACSLIHNPRVLILDEPSTGVDPVSRRELWLMLAEVVSKGVTAIISTPYMDEAERCSEVAILFEGQIIAQGQPAALKKALPYEIVEVKAKPRKDMRSAVSKQKDMVDWRPVGDRIRIAVYKEKTTPLVASLRDELTQNKAEVRLLRKARPLMEDVFTYSVKNLRGKNA
jgi:ABC-2 type transport system ATP-binding protein